MAIGVPHTGHLGISSDGIFISVCSATICRTVASWSKDRIRRNTYPASLGCIVQKSNEIHEIVSWNPLWENYFPERHGMSLPEQYAAGERFGGFKSGIWYFGIEQHNGLEYEDEEDRSPGTNLLWPSFRNEMPSIIHNKAHVMKNGKRAVRKSSVILKGQPPVDPDKNRQALDSRGGFDFYIYKRNAVLLYFILQDRKSVV